MKEGDIIYFNYTDHNINTITIVKDNKIKDSCYNCYFSNRIYNTFNCPRKHGRRLCTYTLESKNLVFFEITDEL